jgi:hypothetical protein
MVRAMICHVMPTSNVSVHGPDLTTLRRKDMKVKTKVFQLAEELGACFTINSTDRLDVEVEAPRHKTWSCDPGVHCLGREPVGGPDPSRSLGGFAR